MKFDPQLNKPCGQEIIGRKRMLRERDNQQVI